FAVKGSLLMNLVDTLPDGNEIHIRTNSLAGVSREKQIEALTPAVVEIFTNRESVRPRSAATGRSARPDASSIEGYSPEQVRSVLGEPSLTSRDQDGIITWYYDTPQGTLKVYIFDNKASLRRQR